MAWCAAVNCNNKQSNNTSVSYFRLPKDEPRRQIWLDNLGRRKDNLPATVYICSDHFEKEHFDPRHELQIDLYYKGRRKKRELLDTAIPTIFPHKKAQNVRKSSVKRAERKKQGKIVEELLASSTHDLTEPTLDLNIETPIYAMEEFTKSVDVQTEPVKISQITKLIDRGTQYFDTLVRSKFTQTNRRDILKYIRHKAVQTEANINVQIKASQNNSSRNKHLQRQHDRDDFTRFKELMDYKESSSSSEDEDSSEDEIFDSCQPVNSITPHFEFRCIEDIKSCMKIFGATCSFPCLDDPQGNSHSLQDILSIEKVESLSECSTESRAESSDRDFDYQPDSEIGSTDKEFDETDETDESEAPFFTIGVERKSICDENVMLVYESKLAELMNFCSKCGARITFKNELKNTGSQLSIIFKCEKGCCYRWSSQPSLKNIKGCGNVLIPAATEFAGIPYNKLEKLSKFLNLRLMKRTSYYSNRARYIFPEINSAWKNYQITMANEIRSSGEPLKLCADGQCDTPGHNASYNTVSMMDASSNKIVDFKIVHVKEVANSNSMEKEAFIRSLCTILDELDLHVSVVSTDRHPSIKKLMRVDKRFSHIKHQFDAWHVAKSILKKLMKSKNKKDTRELSYWIPSIINHLYWSINTCSGDGKELVERFTSVIHHTVNRHTFPMNTIYKKCDHAELSEEYVEQKDWLEPGSESHKFLSDIVNHQLLKKDMEHMAEQVNTTMLEVFHGKKIRYLPKSTYFGMEKMIAGTQVAALEHNYNVNRPQKYTEDSEGNFKPQFVIAYSKPNQRFVAKVVKEEVDHTYVFDIFRKIIARVERGEKVTPDERRKRQLVGHLIAPAERPERESVIRNSALYKRLRFENDDAWREINEVFQNSDDEEFEGFDSEDECD